MCKQEAGGFIAGVHYLQIYQSKRDPQNRSESFILVWLNYVRLSKKILFQLTKS